METHLGDSYSYFACGLLSRTDRDDLPDRP
jgi:hypothetical protein